MRYALEDDILVITMPGAPTAEQFVAQLRAIMADPGVPAGLALLIDVRGADSAPSASDVRRVSAFFRENTAFFGRVSALVVDGPLQFGVGRMGAAYEAANDRVLNVFFDEAQARAFLRAHHAGVPV
jgi:hypothetical protein